MNNFSRLLCKEELEPELAQELGRWAELVKFDGSQDPIDFDIYLLDGKGLSAEALLSDDLTSRVLGVGRTVGIFDLSFSMAQWLTDILETDPIEPGYFVTISRRPDGYVGHRTFR